MSTPLPSEKEEVWRYSPIGDLDLERFEPVAADGATPGGQDLVASLAAALGATAAQVLVHNGWPVWATNTWGAGLAVGGSGDVAGAVDIVGSVLEGGDALVRLNDAFAPDTVVVDVPPGVRVEDPILVVHWCDAEAGAMFPRTSVRAGGGPRSPWSRSTRGRRPRRSSCP